MTTLEGMLGSADVEVSRILEKALQGHDLDEEDIVSLFCVNGASLLALLTTADRLREETVGDAVTYVVNRNINFTNVCVKRCSFCAFSRTYRSEEGYYLAIDEIVRRAREAADYGATEVCIQAGLAPDMEGDLYIRICRAVKQALPQLHIHAFSPEEILYGCRQSGMTFHDYLSALKDAGIGSLPGTSAEILDDEVRDRISPGRITTAEWQEIITTAHTLGIRTTSTIMYGHVETARHCARHLLLLRDMQRHTGGFTEFVPLSFVHTDTPMYNDGLVKGIRPGATGNEVLRMHAVSRLALTRDIPNIQVAWVKEGTKLAQVCLAAGANDLGGTLINESISTAAGAGHGQLMRPREMRRMIRTAGRVPVERSTLYQTLHRFDDGDEAQDPLDKVDDRDAGRFGSYRALVESGRFRFIDERPPARPNPS
jgi:FO synthase subunit 2